MPYIDREGVRVYYESHGAGPALLFSHGYAATTTMWQGQVDALSADYRVITWDMRGHGQSDSPDDPAEYSEEKTVEDAAAILRECGEERAVIGGLSLGGYVSLGFHLAHPEMTRALMLFDTGPGYRSAEARAAWNETAERRARDFEERGLDALGRGSEVLIAQHRTASGLARAARGLLAQVDDRVINSLPAIAVPTLIVVGAKDRAYLAGTDYMANKITGATKVVIDDAGHSSNIHQPAAFNAAVREFLAGLP